jgi:hypothetical protein
MSEYLDPAVMNFVSVTAGIALVVALTDLLLIQRHKGTARLAGLQPAIDFVLVIAGYMAAVGTCFVIVQLLGYFAANGSKWTSSNESGIMDSIIVESHTLNTFTKKMIGATTTLIVTWFSSVVIFEVWCLLRILLQRSMRKLTVA